MKNALILHGTSNNSQGNWFPWLKRELEKKEWRIWVPDLPHADTPNIDRYNKYVLSNHAWKLDKDSFLIGHSSGAVAIMGLLQALSDEVVVDTCILVGAFRDDLGWSSLTKLFITPFDFEKIKKHSRRFIFIHSDNDPHCPLEGARFLAEKLQGELIVLKGQGHFNLETSPSYTQFPFLFDKIMSLVLT